MNILQNCFEHDAKVLSIEKENIMAFPNICSSSLCKYQVFYFQNKTGIVKF